MRHTKKKHSAKSILCIALSLVLSFSVLPLAYATNDNLSSNANEANSNNNFVTEESLSDNTLSFATQLDSDSQNYVDEEAVFNEEENVVEGELIIVYEDELIDLDEDITIDSKNTFTQDETAIDVPQTLNDIGIESQTEIASDNSSSIALATLDDDISINDAIADLQQVEGVAYAQPNYKYSAFAKPANDTYANESTAKENYQYYLDSANLRNAWDYINPSNKVSVAVLDSGCNMNHPDLQGNLNATYAWDAMGNVKLTSAGLANGGDPYGHGTLVAGVLSGVANNSIGGAGSAYNCVEMIPIRVLDNEGNSSTSYIVSALDYIADLVNTNKVPNLKVLNMSLGGYIKYDATMYSKLLSLYRDLGITIVCAGGNGIGGVPQTQPTYPADYPECISVTSLTKTGGNSIFSDYNENKDISAPGEEIITTSNTGGYKKTEGTSFSTPMVAATCAIMYSKKPNITPAEVEELLKSTAGPISSNVHSTSGSAGALDAGAALQKMDSSQTITTWEPNTSATVSTTSGLATITVKGTNAPKGVSNVSVAVWGNANGQNDLRWYKTTKYQNGDYIASVPLSNHRETGAYTVHVYATINGATSSVAKTSFTVDSSSGTISAAINNSDSSITYTIRVNAPFGIASVQLPVWCSSVGGQDDIRWYLVGSATNSTSGNYTFTVKMADHYYQDGSYVAHLYVTDKLGIMSCVAASTTQMKAPETMLSALGNSSSVNKTLTIEGPKVANATAVYFPTWSTSNGQDDIVWYSASKVDNGKWSVSISVARHHSTGDFLVHCYANIANKLTFIDSTRFNVPSPSGTITLAKADQEKGEITYNIDVISPLGISYVQLPTWCSSVGGQDDICWYLLKGNVKSNEGTYSITVKMSDHMYQSGSYVSHLYVTDKAGIMSCVAAKSQILQAPPTEVSVDGDSTALRRTVTVSGGIADIASTIYMPTWSRDGGQDDIIWYGAIRGNDGKWRYSIPLANHRSNGEFIVHVYAVVGGSLVYVGKTDFDVPQVTGNISITAFNSKASIVEFTMQLNAPLGIQSVDLAVWCSSVGGQDDIGWYKPRLIAGDAYKATYQCRVSPIYHMNQHGTYIAHVYVTDTVGVQRYLGAAQREVP